MLPTGHSPPFESTMAGNRLTIVHHVGGVFEAVEKCSVWSLSYRKKDLYWGINKVSVARLGARVGIRTRVSGMKTHHDGPSYTTRATIFPRSIGLMRGSVILPHQVGHPTIFWKGQRQGRK